MESVLLLIVLGAWLEKCKTNLMVKLPPSWNRKTILACFFKSIYSLPGRAALLEAGILLAFGV